MKSPNGFSYLLRIFKTAAAGEEPKEPLLLRCSNPPLDEVIVFHPSNRAPPNSNPGLSPKSSHIPIQ